MWASLPKLSHGCQAGARAPRRHVGSEAALPDPAEKAASRTLRACAGVERGAQAIDDLRGRHTRSERRFDLSALRDGLSYQLRPGPQCRKVTVALERSHPLDSLLALAQDPDLGIADQGVDPELDALDDLDHPFRAYDGPAVWQRARGGPSRVDDEARPVVQRHERDESVLGGRR